MVKRSLSPWLWGVLGGSHSVNLLAPEHQPRGQASLALTFVGRGSELLALPTQGPPTSMATVGCGWCWYSLTPCFSCKPSLPSHVLNGEPV